MVRPFAVIGFTLFFALAVIFEFGQTAAVILLSVAAAALVFCVFFRGARRDYVIPTACITVMVAVALSFSSYILPMNATKRLSGDTHSIKASVVSLEEHSGERYYTKLRATEIDGEEYELNIRLSSKEKLGFLPYDTVEGNLELYDIGNTKSSRAYYLSDNVFVGGYAKGELSISHPEKKPIGYYSLALRAGIKKTVSELIPGEKGALATALLIGDKSQLPDDISTAFSSAGISHLVAVSGLHLSVWCLFILKIFEAFRLKERLGAAISAGFVLLFMSVSGFTYSVLRSGFMMLVMLTGKLISRQSDSLNSLGISMTVLCFINPYSVLSLGLKLSFLSTLGIIVGSGAVKLPFDRMIYSVKNRYLRSLCESFFGLIKSTVFACAFTLPVMILDMGEISLLAIASNLVSNFPASACMIFSGIAALSAQLPFLSFVTAGLADFAGICADVLIRSSKALAALPFSQINATSVLFKLWLIVAFIVLAVSVLFYRLKKHNAIKAALAVCTVTFAVTCVASVAISRTAVKIVVADVGNGSAVVVSSDGETALLGCGGDGYYSLSNIESAVSEVGTNSIDLLLIPRVSEGESSLALDVIDGLSPSYILVGEMDSDLDSILKTEKYALSPNGKITFGDVQLQYKTTQTASTATLNFNGATAFIAFRPSEAVDSESNGDILILRENLPKGIAAQDYTLTLLSADEGRSSTVMGKLLSLGANAYATAGQGNLIVTVFPSGKMFIERTD